MQIILSIYCIFLIFFFLNFRKAFPRHPIIHFTLGIVLVGMLIAPIGVRMLERDGLICSAQVLAFIIYCWMGFIIIYFSCGLSIKAVGYILKFFYRKEYDFLCWDRVSFMVGVLTSLLLCLYGYRQAMDIRTEYLSISTPKISAGQKIRVVQISDVHLGLIVGKKRLVTIIEAIRVAKPDVLVVTGDLVDGDMDGLDGISTAFADLTPPLGRYAVLGNHEYHSGSVKAKNFIEKSGFVLLQDASHPLKGGVTLVGVDDAGDARHPGWASGKPEHQVLGTAALSTYKILLKHRPILNPASKGLYDLQLSGHTHGGQIFPFNIVTWLVYQTKTGLSDNNGQHLYVSRGTGTWGPPFRVLSPPEVTVIDLVSSRDVE